MPTTPELVVKAAIAAGKVANYCDHAEHNEVLDRRWVIDSAEEFRSLALVIATMGGVELRKAFVAFGQPWDGRVLNCLKIGSSQRDVQRALIDHDMKVNPDVMGRARCDQLRHHAMRTIILVARIADNTLDKTTAVTSLALGIRLATVMFEKLPEDVAVGWS